MGLEQAKSLARVQRDGKTVRLWTRNGRDWSARYPLITEAALRNRNSSFILDGEDWASTAEATSTACIRKHDHEIEFYAFDILVSDGERISAGCRCRCARPT